jgi:hypothetical protein
MIFHVPMVIGFALAFAGIPYYDNFLWICHIPSPPIGQSYRYVFAIALIPVTVAIVLSATAMFLVYIKVRRQSQTANRWRLGNGGGADGKLARRVFWQSFFFVVALYGSWPILVLAEYSGDNRRLYELYGFWVVALTLAPLQGFFNFFVYTRPKMLRYWKQCRQRHPRSPSQQTQSRWTKSSFLVAFRRLHAVSIFFGSQNGTEAEATSPEDSDGVLMNNDSQK